MSTPMALDVIGLAATWLIDATTPPGSVERLARLCEFIAPLVGILIHGRTPTRQELEQLRDAILG